MSDLNRKLVYTHRPEQQQIKKSSESPEHSFFQHLQGSGQGLPWKCFKQDPQKHFKWFTHHKLSRKYSWAHLIKHREFHSTQNGRINAMTLTSRLAVECRWLEIHRRQTDGERYPVKRDGVSFATPPLPLPPRTSETLTDCWLPVGSYAVMTLPPPGGGEEGLGWEGGGGVLVNEWMNGIWGGTAYYMNGWSGKSKGGEGAQVIE